MKSIVPFSLVTLTGNQKLMTLYYWMAVWIHNSCCLFVDRSYFNW